MRHALEPDHLAAVSTFAAQQPGAGRAAWLGVLWGVGHTVALLALAGVLTMVGLTLPEPIELGLELAVAVMVTGLGVRALVQAVRDGRAGPVAPHSHFGVAHVHASGGEHVHVSKWTFAVRPLVVGLVHGLAGSGALTALALPTRSERLTYIALFGLGSVAGMGLLTGVLGATIGRLPLKSSLLGLTGLASTTIGLWWGWETASKLIS